MSPKSKNYIILSTPYKHNTSSPDANIATPSCDLRVLTSPNVTKVLPGLKHDEKSSSFKRIQFNAIPINFCSGRIINFDNLERRKVFLEGLNFSDSSQQESSAIECNYI